MRHFMGIGGECLHDSGITVIDESGNIAFASMWERFSGRKHDPNVSPEFFPDLITYPLVPFALVSTVFKFRNIS